MSDTSDDQITTDPDDHHHADRITTPGIACRAIEDQWMEAQRHWARVADDDDDWTCF